MSIFEYRAGAVSGLFRGAQRGNPKDEAVVNPENEDELVCGKCGVPLVQGEAKFTYLGHTFTHSVPKCPRCGMAYISEELTRGRIAEVETMLEDK
jgi:ribosomal protein S27AE